MKNNAVFRIAVFYLLAISISNVFRFHLFGLDKLENDLPYWLLGLTAPLQAIGILTGAFLSLHLLKKTRKPKYSLFGTSVKWSLIMILIPLILMLITGVENPDRMNSHIFALASGFGTLIYCYFEEIGWRGYLQDELRHLKEWQRILLIGSLWYIWHLSFLKNASLDGEIIFLGILILSSWGLGKVIEMTKSVLAVTAFHLIINVTVMNSLTRSGISSAEKWIITAISIVLWILVLVRWEKFNERNATEKP